MPQLPEQLSSAIQPGPVTLGNGIQCPLREKILLRPPVSSKTSTGNIKDGGLEGTPQLFRIPQSTQTPQISTQPVHKLLSYPLTDSSYIGLLVHPERTYSFTPQLPDQLCHSAWPCNSGQWYPVPLERQNSSSSSKFKDINRQHQGWWS